MCQIPKKKILYDVGWHCSLQSKEKLEKKLRWSQKIKSGSFEWTHDQVQLVISVMFKKPRNGHKLSCDNTAYCKCTVYDLYTGTQSSECLKVFTLEGVSKNMVGLKHGLHADKRPKHKEKNACFPKISTCTPLPPEDNVLLNSTFISGLPSSVTLQKLSNNLCL